MKLLSLKLFLTLLISIALLLPFIDPSMGSGFLREMQTLGPIGSIIVLAVFLVFVFFYCKDLQKTLELITPQNQLAKPKSVWLMFLIPYNFIEDFFIVYNIAASLKNEAKTNTSLANSKDFGLYTGIGWCVAQIVSLAPGELGQLASLLAIILWIVHWRFIRSTIAILANR